MQVTLEGMDSVLRRVAVIAAHAARPQPALKAAQRILGASIARNFAQAGRPDRWPRRVSNAAGQFIRPDTQTHPLLRKSGRMAAAASSTNHGGDSISRITIAREASQLEQGLTVPYAIYHQSDAPRRRLPRRPFLLLHAEDATAIREAARLFLWSLE